MKASGFVLIVCLEILFFATVSPVAAGKPSARVETTDLATTASPSYHYNPSGKADPFKPFMETDSAVINKKAKDLKKKEALSAPKKVLSPLQQKDIDQYFLVGIAGDQHRRTAIVEDKAAKKHYPLCIGTTIGKNQGRVTQILPDRVIVEEKITDDQKRTKKIKVNRITMFLHKDQ
jgi:type IV pilus assembly protein PilP